MWTQDSYYLHLDLPHEEFLVANAKQVFNWVWRYDFSAPGFCLLDFGPRVESHALRSFMLSIKEQLNSEGAGRGARFVYRSLGRFDQQETTKFHLDGAPEKSLLVLGYEPSNVRSRLSLADYARCAHDMGIEPRKFLDEYNPMYRTGQELLNPFVTELPQPLVGHSRILLINNSSLPFSNAGASPLGVLHKAEIIDPNPSERRIVNSMMLAVGSLEEVEENWLKEFVTTEEVSNKY